MMLLNQTINGTTLYWDDNIYSLDKDFTLSKPISNGQIGLFLSKDNFVNIVYNRGLLTVSLYMNQYMKNWCLSHLFRTMKVQASLL